MPVSRLGFYSLHIPMATAKFQAVGHESPISQGSSAAGAESYVDRARYLNRPRSLLWRVWDLFIRLVDTYMPVALPSSPSRVWWTLWLLFLVMYVSVDVPLHIAFETWREEQAVALLGWISSATFLMDIAVNFRTAYVDDHGEVVRTPGLIASNYLRGMFVLDLLSTIPMDDILDTFLHGDHHENAYWLGLLRLPRLYTVTRQLNYIVPVKYSNLVSVSKLLGVMLLTAHWAACIWYYLSFEITADWPWVFTMNCRTCPDLELYNFAFYRAFLVMLGDRPMTYNNVERIFVIVLLFIGACMYAIVMGSMSLLVSSMWSMASRHKQRAAVLQDALRYNGASTAGNLRSRVDQYFDHMATHEHPGPEGMSLLSELPATLHAEVLASVFEPLLTRVQLFAFCERPFVWRLAQRLRLSMFMPKDTIYDVGSVGHEMYLIWRGVVVLTEPDGCMTALLTEGDHFGELGVMSAGTPRPQRATAMCAVDALLLGRADLLDAMRDFPESANVVITRAHVQLEDHEIGPTVWAASMAATHVSSVDDDSSSSRTPSSPRRTPDKPSKSILALRGSLKQSQSQPQSQPQAQSLDDSAGGVGSSGGAAGARCAPADAVTAVLAAVGSSAPSGPGLCDPEAPRRRLLAILLRQRRRPAVDGQAEASSAAAAAPMPAAAAAAWRPPTTAGPVAEATTGLNDAANDTGGQLGLLMSTDVTSFNPSTTDSPRRRLSSSSEDSLCDMLLKAPSKAKDCAAGQQLPGCAPQAIGRGAARSHPPPQRPFTAHAASSPSRRHLQPPRVAPHTRTTMGGERPAGDEAAAAGARLLPSRLLPGRGSNCRQREPEPAAGHQTHRVSGCAPADHGTARSSRSQADVGGSVQGGRNASGNASGTNTSFLQGMLPFRVLSTRPSSPSATGSNTRRPSTPPPLSPLKQQQQQQPTGTGAAFGIDPRDLAALERVRFSSQRPADAGGVVRYLSKRARQQEANTHTNTHTIGSTNTNTNAHTTSFTSASGNANACAMLANAHANAGAVAAWGKPNAEPGCRGIGGGCGGGGGGAGAAAEDRSYRAGLNAVPQFDLSEFEEIDSSSAGQQRIPTASQLLLMPPQPFLGVDPLGPLFEAPAAGQPPGLPAASLEACWRPRPGTLHGARASETIPAYAPHDLPSPFGGLADDAVTRQLVGPTGRRSMRPVLRGSGGRMSVASSLGPLNLETSSSERLVEDWLSEQRPCCQGRCAKLEHQVAQLRRQLAAADARVESILEDPFHEPAIEAKAQCRLQDWAASHTKRTDEALTQLLERVRGMSAGIEGLSLQVCVVGDRIQRMVDERQGGFGAVNAADLRLSATAAAAAAAAAASSAALHGSVRVDAPFPVPEAAPAIRTALPAQLVGLLGPPIGSGGQQMGVLLPLSTASPAATTGGSLRSNAGPSSTSFRQAPGSQSLSQGQQAMYLRRGSMLSMRAMPEDEVLGEGPMSVGPSAPSDTTAGGASSAGGTSSFQVPDQALLAATMNRAAGKNVRRRQSARDLSALAAAAAAQQQQQQQHDLPSQPQSPGLLSTSQPEAILARSSLSRTNSRVEGARGRGRSASALGMSQQPAAADKPSAPGLSPASSRRVLQRPFVYAGAGGAGCSEGGGVEAAVASPGGAGAAGTAPRVVVAGSGSGGGGGGRGGGSSDGGGGGDGGGRVDGPPSTHTGAAHTMEIMPAISDVQGP